MRYFNNITTIEELKKAYKKLAFKLHPDRGGDSVEFQSMVNEYDQLFKQLEKGTNTTGAAKTYKDIIDSLMKFEGLTIDIIGTWIWLSGDTYNVKEDIKKLGFLWSTKHKKWFYNGDTVKVKFRSKSKYNDLKNAYGCDTITTAKKSYKRQLA